MMSIAYVMYLLNDLHEIHDLQVVVCATGSVDVCCDQGESGRTTQHVLQLNVKEKQVASTDVHVELLKEGWSSWLLKSFHI